MESCRPIVNRPSCSEIQPTARPIDNRPQDSILPHTGIMNVPVNLASQQFRRDRPLMIGSAVAGILLLALLGMLISLNLGERGRLKSTQADIDVLDRKLRSVAAEQAKLDA